MSTAQNAYVLNPKKAQGFLLLNDRDFPDVENWQVNVYERYADTSGVQDTLLKSYRMSSVNYLHLDKRYYSTPLSDSSGYYIHILGYDSNGDILVNERPQFLEYGDSGTETVCRFICNGTYFAWQIAVAQEIDQYGYLNQGNYYLRIDNAAKHISDLDTYVPYYRYMSQNEFDNFANLGINSSEWECHRIQSDNSFFFYGNSNSDHSIIRLQNVDASDNLQNSIGQVLTGTVYGVQKTLCTDYVYPSVGPFISSGGYCSPSQRLESTKTLYNYTAAPLFTPQTINGVWTTVYPALDCSNGADFGSPDPNDNQSQYPCMLLADVTLFNTNDPLTQEEQISLWDLIDEVNDCLESASENDGNIFSWPVSLENVSICRIDKDGTCLVLRESDLFDEYGNFIYPPFRMEPGLYQLILTDTNYNIMPYYYDINRPVSNSIEQKDFLNPTVFPVPTYENNYSLRFQATARLDFYYAAYDKNGQRIYNSNFIVDKNSDQSFSIQPFVSNVPNGLIAHVFTFRDGSVKTITSLKMPKP